jgi:hypothetical protein
MKDQYRVDRVPAAVTLEHAQRPVMKFEFGKRLARLEAKVRDPEIGLAHFGSLGGARGTQQRKQQRADKCLTGQPAPRNLDWHRVSRRGSVRKVDFGDR